MTRQLARLFVWILLTGLGLTVQAQLLEIREAQVTVTVDGRETHHTTPLPYHWDRLHPGQLGEASFEARLVLAQVPVGPYGIYIPRVGNAYAIWLNGTLLQRNGDLQKFNGADFTKMPRHILIPAGLLLKDNLIKVQIRADVQRHGGLSPLLVGPNEVVFGQYLKDYRARGTGTLVIAIISLLVGLLAAGLWATQVETLTSGQSRRDRLYLFSALAEISWASALGVSLIENPPIHWPWWGLVHIATTGAWACCVTLFCAEIIGWGHRREIAWFGRWLGLLLVATVAAAACSFSTGYSPPLTVIYILSGLCFLGFGVMFTWAAFRGQAVLPKIVAAVLLVNVVVGCYDLYLLQLSPTYAYSIYMRFFSVLFGLTLACIMLLRFRAASRQVRDLLANMTRRIALKELELAQSYQVVEQVAREQERTSERTRILRDMHDGVGAHLSSAIRQLQSGKASDQDVLHTLRDSLDQLKLSIDAMNFPAGDVTALLANLRYRLEPRFKASDIELQWDVDLLEPLTQLDLKAMRQLQFMVYEAISNVLQHAHAHRLRIELRSVARGRACLRIIDDGQGFDPDRQRRRGLSSLGERAAAIAADLSITSTPGKTVVEILLG